MSNVPLFPPAERFGAAMLALVQSIAARAGWWLPEWVIVWVEGEIRGFVEAISLLVALAREGKLPPLPTQQQAPAKPRRASGTARTRTPRRRQSRQRPRHQAAPTGKVRTRPEPPAARQPWPRSQTAPRPNRHRTRRRTSGSTPLLWHVHNVTISK